MPRSSNASMEALAKKRREAAKKPAALSSPRTRCPMTGDEIEIKKAGDMWFAFTDHATCPAPCEGNTISVPVRAGERAPRS